jgi:hypothetical protein
MFLSDVEGETCFPLSDYPPFREIIPSYCSLCSVGLAQEVPSIVECRVRGSFSSCSLSVFGLSM